MEENRSLFSGKFPVFWKANKEKGKQRLSRCVTYLHVKWSKSEMWLESVVSVAHAY